MIYRRSDIGAIAEVLLVGESTLARRQHYHGCAAGSEPSTGSHVSARVGAEYDGGDELLGVTFPDPAQAVCSTVERVGVVPERESVDEADVEAWTNDTEMPVVFVYPEDVQGLPDKLPTCSVAYEKDELSSTTLHGDHMHAAHS